MLPPRCNHCAGEWVIQLALPCAGDGDGDGARAHDGHGMGGDVDGDSQLSFFFCNAVNFEKKCTLFLTLRIVIGVNVANCDRS